MPLEDMSVAPEKKSSTPQLNPWTRTQSRIQRFNETQPETNPLQDETYNWIRDIEDSNFEDIWQHKREDLEDKIDQIAGYCSLLSDKDWELYPYLMIHNLSDIVLSSPNCLLSISSDGLPEDPYLRRLLNIDRITAEKVDRIKQHQTLMDHIFNILKRKRITTEILQPNRLLAHGTYTDNLLLAIEAGGFMSPVGRSTKATLSSKGTSRWTSTNYPDAGATFFSPWEYLQEVDSIHIPGCYTSDKGEDTDITVIYFAKDIIDNVKAIETRMSLTGNAQDIEVAVTSSTKCQEAGELVACEDDDTLLPLEKAYLIIPKDKKAIIVQKLAQKEYSPEWIKDHVFYLPSLEKWEDGGISRNNMRQVLIEHRAEITTWLQQKPLVEDGTQTKLKILPKAGMIKPFRQLYQPILHSI